MGNERSPKSQYYVQRHHNLQCLKEGSSELETLNRNKLKHSIHNASSGYLQVLNRYESKFQRKPGETIFYFSDAQRQVKP